MCGGRLLTFKLRCIMSQLEVLYEYFTVCLPHMGVRFLRRASGGLLKEVSQHFTQPPHWYSCRGEGVGHSRSPSGNSGCFSAANFQIGLANAIEPLGDGSENTPDISLQEYPSSFPSTIRRLMVYSEMILHVSLIHQMMYPFVVN